MCVWCCIKCIYHSSATLIIIRSHLTILRSLTHIQRQIAGYLARRPGGWPRTNLKLAQKKTSTMHVYAVFDLQTDQIVQQRDFKSQLFKTKMDCVWLARITYNKRCDCL